MGDLSQYKDATGVNLKKDDDVLIKGRILGRGNGGFSIGTVLHRNGSFDRSDIVAVKARPIEPECMVNIIGRERGDPYTAEVLSVDRNYAFVLITGGTGEWHHEVLGFDELERI